MKVESNRAPAQEFLRAAPPLARRRGVPHGRGAVAGFTLTELVIVIVIIGILAAFAVPGYQQKVRETRRTDARAALLATANRQERFFTDNESYTASMTALGFAADPTPSENGFYLISAAVAADTYTLTATPQGAQTSDTGCATLTLNSAGVQGSTGGGDCW